MEHKFDGFCFFVFLRDLKSTQKLIEVKKAKVDQRSEDLRFLKLKSQELKKRINAAEVDGRNFSMSQSWLVEPKILVLEIPEAS